MWATSIKYNVSLHWNKNPFQSQTDIHQSHMAKLSNKNAAYIEVWKGLEVWSQVVVFNLKLNWLELCLLKL